MSGEELNQNNEAPEIQAPAAPEVAEVPAEKTDVLAERVPDVDKAQKRLEFKTDHSDYAKAKEQLDAIAVLEGDAQTAAFEEFRSTYLELLLRPAELQLMRSQVDDRLNQGSKPESFTISDELAAKDSWTEEEFQSVFGERGAPPEGFWWTNEDEEGNYKVAPIETVDANEEARAKAFAEANGLPMPNEIVANILTPDESESVYAVGEKFKFLAVQTQEGFKIFMEGEDSPEWDFFQDEIKKAVDQAGYDFEMTETDEGVQLNLSMKPETQEEVDAAEDLSSFVIEHRLLSPEDVLEKLQHLWTRPVASNIYVGLRYKLSMVKGANGVDILLEDSKPEEDADPIWENYQEKLKEALFEAEFNFDARELNGDSEEAAQDVLGLRLSKDKNEAFVARTSSVPEVAEGILNEEGLLEDGTLPHAMTRLDGSTSMEEKWDEYEKKAEATDNFAMKAIYLFVAKILQFIGRFSGGEESASGGEEQNLEPYDGALVYNDFLRFRDYGSIQSAGLRAGEKVAAAAVLAVRRNEKAAHCSAWAKMVSGKMGFDRYARSQHAFVGVDHDRYQGWGTPSVKGDQCDPMSLAPGDMVIALSPGHLVDPENPGSGSPTGYHDQIVVEVDRANGRVLVASQERLNRRKLRWKKFHPNDIAVVTRPEGGNLNYNEH